jgi:chromosome partitioning protein
MIITFASSKGGVGKSTTCAAIASALALEGARVLLIDLDQNRTLDRWARKAPIEGLTVSAIDPGEFGDYFRKAEASGSYDHICIDLPGSREVTLFKALARSDLVVIPAQASEPDLREALVVVKDIRDVSETTRRPIQYRLLLTKVFPLRSRVTDFAYAELAARACPCSAPPWSSARPIARCSSTVSRRPLRRQGRGPGSRSRTCSPRSAPSSMTPMPPSGRQDDMTSQRKPFMAINDDDDAQLEQLARQKGVGKLEKPARESREGEGTNAVHSVPAAAAEPAAKAASKLKTVNLELPDYVWTELKIRAAHQQTSLKHVIMKALVVDGITIEARDMIEDGRRLRGSNKLH